MRKYKNGKEHAAFKDLTEKRFGNLVCKDYVLRNTKSGYRDLRWKCLCDCGSYCYPRTTQLLRKGQTACRLCTIKRTNKARILENNGSLKNRVYRNYKRGATLRRLKFNLTLEEFLAIIEMNCYYCGSGSKVYLGETVYALDEFKRNGIDRKNSSLGYTVKNCVPCCDICNRAKSNLSYEDFMGWLDNLVKFRMVS